jgi:NAD(P)-dependent dehydrogenase (short-subunit alcohol dehydrogenase family)
VVAKHFLLDGTVCGKKRRQYRQRWDTLKDNIKWVVVTGASSGVGLETAKLLLAAGYGVVVTARREDALRSEFGDSENAYILPWDLSEPESIKGYITKATEAVGSLSGLVHSAGIQKLLPFHMTKPDLIEEVFRINTYAAMMLVSSFVKKSIAAELSSIVLISSLAAHEGAPGRSVYAASKAALEGYVTSVACELSKRGARINCIAPGVMDTPMGTQQNALMQEAQKAAINNSYPLGVGRPSDVAELALYLIDEKSRWVTGQTFVIDGGHLTRG